MGAVFDEATKYIRSGVSRFHTPGHSGKARALEPFATILPLDVTEVAGFDSLYEAEGILARCEERLAALFGSRKSLISAGGCTLAIQTMLSLAVPEGGRVAMGRNAHRSACNAAALLGFDISWIYSSSAVSVQDVETVLSRERVDAVYLTSPDYFGLICDIEGISAVCREKGVPLLVDNAHGSHLKFLTRDIHPITLGADMTACSLHKTLPVLTGGALLNIGNPQYIEQAKSRMSMFGSTSPSYLTLESVDLCADWLDGCGREEFARLEKEAAGIKNFAVQSGFSLPHGMCDPVRLTLDLKSRGVSGEAACRIFRECGAECEHFDREHIIFILTPFHGGKDFERLRNGIVRLAEEQGEEFLPAPEFKPPRTALPVRKAVFSDSELIDASAARGRIAAEAVCPCPPGVPVIIPGEVIDENTIALMEYSGISRIRAIK